MHHGEDNMCNCCDLEISGVVIIKQELNKHAHKY